MSSQNKIEENNKNEENNKKNEETTTSQTNKINFETIVKWEIEFEEITIEKQIGSGNFGQVFKGNSILYFFLFSLG